MAFIGTQRLLKRTGKKEERPIIIPNHCTTRGRLERDEPTIRSQGHCACFAIAVWNWHAC